MKHVLPMLVALCWFGGCDEGRPAPEAPNTATASSAEGIPATFFTSSRPEQAAFLNDVKTSASPGDSVVFLARVGGKVDPFVENLAMFIAADPSLQSCEIMGKHDHCPVPQDYCCEDPDLLRLGLATVQFTSPEGRIIPATAEGAGGLESLKFVVVEGEVRDRNNEGLFIVDARKVWVGGKPTYDDRMRGSMTP